MIKTYTKDFKKMCAESVCVHKNSTVKMAEQFSVPLKTLEKWITTYNKDSNSFNKDYVAEDETIANLRKRVRELEATNEVLMQTIKKFDKK